MLTAIRCGFEFYECLVAVVMFYGKVLNGLTKQNNATKGLESGSIIIRSSSPSTSIRKSCDQT